MMLQPARAEDIADACKALARLAAVPGKIAEGLAADDPEAMRNAVIYLIGENRTQGIREIVDRFRASSDLGVFARVQSSRLHQIDGEYAAALADLEDVTMRFPERAAPFWWIGRARCLFELGRPDEAQAVAREGAARFPDNAQAQAHVAALLGRSERWGEALAAWDDIFARFAGGETSEMFVGRAKALFHLDRVEEAQTAAREGAARFPDNAQARAYVAILLGRSAQWAEALAAWDDMFARFGKRATSEMFVGRANALLHLDRVEEATALLEARVADAPDDAVAWRMLASMAAQTGDRERLSASLEHLTGRLAAQSQPDWWAELARARHEARDYAGGAAALAELERRFPDSPLAERERVRLGHRLERGQDELTARVEAGVARFPDDVALRAQWVLMLLAQGRIGLAERFVEALEAEDAQGYALVARLRLETDRGGDAHMRNYLESLARGRDWTYADAASVADFLIQHRAPWGMAFADDLLNGLAARAAGQIWATVLKARIKIARRDDEAALAIIDAIPAAYRRSDVNELRAWAANTRGRLDEAQAIWRRNVRDVYFGAIDCPIETLDRLSRDLPPPENGVTAYVVYRNEAPQWPGFLAHHRKIGVRRFVCFDHMSSDDSCAILLNEPDVVLYQSRDSYQWSSSGRRWVAEIVAREGAQGWGLQVDPDEYFIYPGWETTPLDRLLAYLEARGYAGVRAYMLDMFARRLTGEDGEPAPLSAHRWYDDDYAWIGQERPPYLSPVGGVRQRLFGATEFLHKTPLWRLDAGAIINSHETTPLALADVSGALLHYKLFNITLRGRTASPQAAGLAYLEADTDLGVLRRHSRYAARLAELQRMDLFDLNVSREIGDSLDMTKHGLMTASPGYLDWLRA